MADSAGAPVLNVVVADDSAISREGVRRICESAGRGRIEIVAECEDLDSTLAAVDEYHPDVVVTDIRMPPSHRDEGLMIATILQRSHPETGVILLSQYADPDYALLLFEQSSARRGYLLKDRVADKQTLLDAISTVAAGNTYVDSHIVDSLLAAQAERSLSPLGALTPREREVLALIAEGLSNAAIARRLRLTVRAVERQIGRIFAKLDLGSEADLNRRVVATLAFLANDTSASRSSTGGSRR
jgi:DNA-binding NarL/FixJ family response regulator